MAKKTPQVKFKGDLPKNEIARANIPASITGTSISFPHRHLRTIDTNVEVEVDDGYKLCYRLVPSLAEKGMVCSSAPGNVTDGKISVTVINCGREIVNIKHGDDLVELWIEEDIDFEWVSE